MIYTIVFYRDNQELISTTPWSGDLDSAKRHAESRVTIKAASSYKIIRDNSAPLDMQTSNENTSTPLNDDTP